MLRDTISSLTFYRTHQQKRSQNEKQTQKQRQSQKQTKQKPAERTSAALKRPRLRQCTQSTSASASLYSQALILRYRLCVV
ncbi:unnamed protein product [Ceratitis capitata]|uniref:(Mediterranean fruit fly) hypothetical protein n=1 Tax=Ceratitis capitata TaxID=7213 RepID=A0A811V3H3_CERCA|nr:unnamed protein product [Ceratitis capitata]